MSILGFKNDYGSDSRPALVGGTRKPWAQGPSSPSADNGTRLDADFINSLVGLVRGLLDAFSVAAEPGDDTALAQAVNAAIAAALDSFGIADVDGLTAALAAKAPLASPALVGTPTAPTASLGTNTTQIATMAALQAAIASLINSAPGALDTLDEMAAAFGDDANFAATMTTALAGKQGLNANLTAIAALTTQTFGLSLLTGTNAGAVSTLLALGTAALLDSGVFANNLVKLDGSARLPAVDASQLTNIPGATSIASQGESIAGIDNTKMVTPLRLAQVHGPDVRALAMLVSELKADRINMPDGIFDPLQDTGDVDTGGSTNLDTATAGKIKPSTTAGSDQIPVMTAATTSGVTMSAQHASSIAWQAADSDIDTVYWYTGAGISVTWLKVDFGSGFIIESYLLRCGNDISFPAYMPNAWTLEGSNDGSSWTTLDTRTGIIFSQNTNQTFTISSPASYRYYRLNITANNGGNGTLLSDYQLISPATRNNMTVKSNAFTATTQPSRARLTVQAKPIDAITINTDLIGKVSRDGGTTWTTATLVAETTLADATILYVHDGIDLSAQPSGTSMKWRVESANNKNLELNGAGLRWAA